jgi:hypothetical protein
MASDVLTHFVDTEVVLWHSFSAGGVMDFDRKKYIPKQRPGEVPTDV